MAITVKHKYVSAIPDAGDTTVVQPSNWNDTHDLTGLGTMAEQNANAVAITGGTVSNATLTSDTVSNNLAFTPTTAPSYVEGDVWYDSTAHALAYYNDSPAAVVHIGQDLQIKVINNTGSTIANGTPVYITSTSSGQTYPNIALAKADVASTSSVIGLTNGAIANGAIGYVTGQGTIDGVNTGTFTVGQVLYLSPYSAGQLMNTIPPTGITVQVGVVSYVNSSTGKIYVKQTTPLAVPASIITGILPVANGGTGVTTSTGSGSTVLNTSPTLTTPAITGGTIDNTVIGGTTPAAGTFTTITGQTEVLRGTGQNLLTYSQNILNTTWTNNQVNTTVSATLYTAPDGTTTANDLVETVTNAGHYISNISSVVSGVTYTFSVYLKIGVGATAPSWIQLTLALAGFPTGYANFNVSTGTTGLLSGFTSSSITSVGNGWYRCSITATATATASANTIIAFTNNSNAASRLPTYAGATTSDVLVWGAQLEIGSTLNTYIPTTTTAIYGTPTLSFSGVAGLGLQSDGSLYVSPAGTGAIQAQKTDSTATGGNARGANAVDWQTVRGAATQVASAGQSTVGGGANNSSLGTYSVVAGGLSNLASSTANAIAGGYSNSANSAVSFVGGGFSNSANGNYNFIGGGQSNSGTANAAVTTQAAATNGVTSGSTAVTLAASNASIKVGQLITGTGITTYPHTYVAAISGTSLTLSQNANATGTPTLSFYTPHGVVVGGGNNQATGAYSFIGGGGDAGTAANRNVASGDWSVVVGGKVNTASGISTFIGAGQNNIAGGQSAAVLGGQSNTTSGAYSSILNGFGNTSTGQGSLVSGNRGTTRSITGNNTFSSWTAIDTTVGSAQSSLLVIGKQTTDATATILTSDGGAASGTNQVILPNNSAYYFTGEVISGVTGGGDSKGWSISGVIKRGANAGATTLVGSTVTSLYADAGAATWTIALTADTTNGGLKVTFTGQASTTIRTVCQIRTTEMTY